LTLMSFHKGVVSSLAVWVVVVVRVMMKGSGECVLSSIQCNQCLGFKKPSGINGGLNPKAGL
jgi:hypothetical protein